jgi:hypothetical protein
VDIKAGRKEGKYVKQGIKEGRNKGRKGGRTIQEGRKEEGQYRKRQNRTNEVMKELEGTYRSFPAAPWAVPFPWSWWLAAAFPTRLAPVPPRVRFCTLKQQEMRQITGRKGWHVKESPKESIA